MKNVWKYTKNIFLVDDFLKATGNHYRVVSQKPYLDKKGTIGKKGVTLTLMILEDNTDYGVDKTTGIERDNNIFETFDATILTGDIHLEVKKGDLVSLIGFRGEYSYVLNYDLILRFDAIEKVSGHETA